MVNSSNTYPIFQANSWKKNKELLLNQRAFVFWFTGLSGSGKSTLVQLLEKKLNSKGFYTVHLDGDNIRQGLGNNLGFTDSDRAENIRRVAECAKLFLNNGTIVLSSFISPTRDIRMNAAEIIGINFFKEIHVHCDLNVCEERDPKGLYKKARLGQISNFTGIDAKYEAPSDPFIKIDTAAQSAESAAEKLFKEIENLVSI